MNKPAELLRLLRPHQWVKNAFVFTGLLFGHAWHDARMVTGALTTFFAFCLVSGAIYALNDIADLEQDRHHPEKSKRPLASGRISVRAAMLLAGLLSTSGFILSYAASPAVFVIVFSYALLSLTYSHWLKHVVILDVFVIAAGFMLRILAGTLGLGIPPSQWLLLCGLMVTLFLGFAKRHAEIVALAGDKTVHRKVLEHYNPALLDKMIVITATGVIMSYSLYTMSADTLRTHGTANLIYTVPFVIYGVFRYIFLLHHRSRGGDPSQELLRDPHLFIVVGAWLAATLLLIT